MRINRLRDTLIEILIRNRIAPQTIHCFESLKSVEHKVNSIEVLLKSYHLLNDVPIRSEKCDKKSVENRKKGNEFFSIKNRNLCKAMMLYNESICFAETDSENLAYGYANRSAVYFEWNEWEKCLENIDLAQQCANFPDSLKDKLTNREMQCRENLNKEHDSKNSLDYIHCLSYPEHSKVPGIANCLELKENEQYGRYIVATKELNIGDVIAIEHPFILSLAPELEYQRCLNCLSEQMYSLIPCKYCTHAMFCNEICRDKCFELFHKFECSVIHGLFDVFDNPKITALRAILKLFSNTDVLLKIKNYIKTPKATKENIFTVNASDNSMFEHFKAVYGLESHLDKRDKVQQYQIGITAATFVCIMKEDENFLQIFDNGFSNLFYELIFQFVHIQNVNNIAHLIQNGLRDREPNEKASGIYPFQSLINHSCIPNCLGFGYNNQFTTIVARKIKKGEQIFINYV